MQVSFFTSCESGHVEVERSLKALQNPKNDMNHPDWKSVLHMAAEMGHLEVSRLLLDANALELSDIDGFRPLHLAVSEEHVEVLRLLDAGAKKEASDCLGCTHADHAARCHFEAHRGLESSARCFSGKDLPSPLLAWSIWMALICPFSILPTIYGAPHPQDV